MSDERDIFDWLKQHAQPLKPTPEEIERAHRRLDTAISAEKAATSRRETRRRLVTWMAAAAAVTVAAVAVIPFLARDQAEAALIEVAQAAREATPVDIPEGSFVYAESTGFNLVGREAEEFGLEGGSVSYLLPRTRRVWKSPDNEFVMLEVTYDQPTFFDPDAEAEVAYYKMGLDDTDQVGETTREQFAGVIDPVDEINWPNNRTDLLDAMTTYLDTESPTTAELVNLAVNLLRERNPSPQLRAAVLEVLADLPVELVREDRETITIGIIDAGRNQTFTLSRSGHLLAETATLIDGDPQAGIPPGAVTTDIQYRPIEVVEALPK